MDEFKLRVLNDAYLALPAVGGCIKSQACHTHVMTRLESRPDECGGERTSNYCVHWMTGIS
jgi:hypothetical protein